MATKTTDLRPGTFVVRTDKPASAWRGIVTEHDDPRGVICETATGLELVARHLLTLPRDASGPPRRLRARGPIPRDATDRLVSEETAGDGDWAS